MEKPELKPCPFCGGPAEEVHTDVGGTDMAYIRCVGCYVSTRLCHIDINAFNDWNMRDDEK